MRPKEQRETDAQDLFRARLDQIIDVDHALVRLARAIDWRSLEEKLVRFTPTNPAVHCCRRG